MVEVGAQDPPPAGGQPENDLASRGGYRPQDGLGRECEQPAK